MEKKDEELIRRWIGKDPELKARYYEHLAYEKRLEELRSKPIISSHDELEIKRIKKLKLAGRDRIEQILEKYRKMES